MTGLSVFGIGGARAARAKRMTDALWRKRDTWRCDAAFFLETLEARDG
jgi:hypothetical protein